MTDRTADETRRPPGQGHGAAGAPTPIPGALLNDAQVRWLRQAVIVMTTILVVGIAALIGRVIYLARGGGRQAASAAASEPAALPLLAQMRLSLPPAAEVRGVTAAGSRLAVYYSSPAGGEAIAVLDLATGRVVSRVTIDRDKPRDTP